VSADGECETEILESDITIASSDKQSWSQPLIFLPVTVKKKGNNESNEANTIGGFNDGKICATEILKIKEMYSFFVVF
jgi:hypothetical protein